MFWQVKQSKSLNGQWLVNQWLIFHPSCTVSSVFAQQLVEHFKNTLRNISTDWMLCSVQSLIKTYNGIGGRHRRTIMTKSKCHRMKVTITGTYCTMHPWSLLVSCKVNFFAVPKSPVLCEIKPGQPAYKVKSEASSNYNLMTCLLFPTGVTITRLL